MESSSGIRGLIGMDMAAAQVSSAANATNTDNSVDHANAGASAKSIDPTKPIQSSRARQRAETKERIFEMALREFREVGLAAAQIDRIAKKAGIARGTFYFHFPTKGDVMLELARRIEIRVVQRASLVVASGPSLHEFLSRIVDVLIDEHSRVSDAGLNAELLSLYMRRPYDLEGPLHNVPTLTDEFAGYLHKLIGRGELNSKSSAEQLSLLIMSSLFGVLARVPRGEEAHATCNALVDLFVAGLEQGAQNQRAASSG